MELNPKQAGWRRCKKCGEFFCPVLRASEVVYLARTFLVLLIIPFAFMVKALPVIILGKDYLKDNLVEGNIVSSAVVALGVWAWLRLWAYCRNYYRAKSDCTSCSSDETEPLTELEAESFLRERLK